MAVGHLKRTNSGHNNGGFTPTVPPNLQLERTLALNSLTKPHTVLFVTRTSISVDIVSLLQTRCFRPAKLGHVFLYRVHYDP